MNATCTLGISFAPVGTDARAATVTLTDNATNSPQIINLGGFANSALTLGAALSGSTSATINAGQTAQYNLQITPGAGFTGSVSFTCSGAPVGAAIQGPSSLQISNATATPFTVSVTTTGASENLPFLNVPRLAPFPAPRALTGIAAGILLLLLLGFKLCVEHKPNDYPRRLAIGGALGAMLLFVLLGTTLDAAGCGGGSTSIAAASSTQGVTPQGTSTIIVTPAATSVSGNPLQLQPIQLTLTVN